jgi:hypothetical protein
MTFIIIAKIMALLVIVLAVIGTETFLADLFNHSHIMGEAPICMLLMVLLPLLGWMASKQVVKEL